MINMKFVMDPSGPSHLFLMCFEPEAPRVQGGYSTAELRAQLL